MGLDDGGRSPDRRRLNYVRIESSLNQKAHVRELAGFLLEDTDEFLSYYLSFLLGIFNPRQAREESIGGIDSADRQVQSIAKSGKDIGELILSEDAIIDEDAGEPISDGLMHEESSDG